MGVNKEGTLVTTSFVSLMYNALCRTIVIFNCPIFNFKFIRKNSKVTQYRGYLDFVHEVGETCGFQVEEDSLRIPSTKRVNVFSYYKRR